MSNRVVITGMGWITPMGHSIESVWPRLLAGESGIAPTSLFDAAMFPTSISAEVKNFRFEDHIFPIGSHAGAGRNTQFALAACSQAWKNAGLNGADLDLDRIGIYLGSGEGSLDFDAFTTCNLLAWKPELNQAGHGEVGPVGDGINERDARGRAGAQHAALALGGADGCGDRRSTA